MLPVSIRHSGKDYDLRHLAQQFRTFLWKGSDGSDFHFSVRVRYTDHCISEKVDVAAIPESCLFANNRVFDVDRYKWSLQLPSIVEGLFAKPTSSIQLTPEKNGYVFRLTMNHPLAVGEKYYCFFRLKRSHEFIAGEHPSKLDLVIESAYARFIDPARANERIMFGRLAERLVK